MILLIKIGNEKYYTLEEVEKEIRINKDLLESWCSKGKIKYKEIGNKNLGIKKYISKSQIDSMINFSENYSDLENNQKLELGVNHNTSYYSYSENYNENEKKDSRLDYWLRLMAIYYNVIFQIFLFYKISFEYYDFNEGTFYFVLGFIVTIAFTKYPSKYASYFETHKNSKGKKYYTLKDYPEREKPYRAESIAVLGCILGSVLLFCESVICYYAVNELFSYLVLLPVIFIIKPTIAARKKAKKLKDKIHK